MLELTGCPSYQAKSSRVALGGQTELMHQAAIFPQHTMQLELLCALLPHWMGLGLESGPAWGSKDAPRHFWHMDFLIPLSFVNIFTTAISMK